jgi:hypothetical protein
LGNIDGVINEPFETTKYNNRTDFGLSIEAGKTLN